MLDLSLRLFPGPFIVCSRSRSPWLWSPAIFKEIGYCLSLLKSRDNDRAHSIPRWCRLQANIMKHVVIWRVFDAENVVLSSSKVYHYESEMPGDNCSVFGCGSCRRTKGIGIWKLPSARNAEYKKWREEWLSAITKTRVTKISKNRSTVTRYLPVRNISTLRM